MLHRIWGRTSSRSSNRKLPHFRYSPLGPIEQYPHPPDEFPTRWTIVPNDIETALTLIGYALMNQRMVRIHGNKEVTERLKALVNERLPSLTMTEKQTRGKDFSQELSREIEVWQNAFSDWEKAVAELEQITFGALNSLEVLQSILHAIQGLPLQHFHDVAIESFRWTHEEFRILDRVLEDMTPSRQKRLMQFHQLEAEQIHPNVLAETPVEDTQTRIGQWLEDLDRLSATWSALTGQIHRKIRQQPGHHDWAATWNDLARSTINRFQDDPDHRELLLEFTEQLNRFEQSVLSSRFLSSWSGFQSISFAEIKQEIKQIHHRLQRLQSNLIDLREIAAVKIWYMDLPLPAREMLKAHSGQDMKSFRSAFSAWYLSRWIEYQTPENAWLQLSCQQAMSGIQDNLRHLTRLWLQHLGRLTETLQWSDWLIAAESSGSTLRNQPAIQTVDLYLEPGYASDGGAALVQPVLARQYGPELDRLIGLISDLPPVWREELPAPVHRHASFWSPTLLTTGRDDLSIYSVEWSSDQTNV